MTIAMQGLWTVSVVGKNAAWPQRFKIEGSTNGVDGEYDETSPAFTITGPQWGITIEHNPPGAEGWTQSRHRLSNFRKSGGQFLFDIQTDDSGNANDEDFNDLILNCSMALSSSEYVVYGKLKSYSGTCLFNPCFPYPYYVIDYPWQLKELLKYEPTRKIIEKLYPERIKEFEKKPPIPLPDPVPFRPLMIPSGLTEKQELNVLQTDKPLPIDLKQTSRKAAGNESLESQRSAYSLSATSSASNTFLQRDDYLMLGQLYDSFQLRPCKVSPVSQTLLRFTEYDRTTAEKLGEPYQGEGNKHTLGQTATDEFGNYIFRFALDGQQLVDEVSDFAEGEDLLTEIRPDIIIELMETLPDGVLYETAPYFNIPNVKRINLCLPVSDIELPRTACQGGRAIQALGNLSIITNGTELHADGTVSNTNNIGPQVDHAAWYGTVDLFACFLDLDPYIKYYTIRSRRLIDSSWEEWKLVNNSYTHSKQQSNGSWEEETIGPLPLVMLRVNGTSEDKMAGWAYLNIEDKDISSEWANSKRDRKFRINTAAFQPGAGLVEFKIEGYDSTGEKVPDAEDTIGLYIDNTWSVGEIDYIKLGFDDPGECAFFELPTAGEALDIRYRVTDAEGFMSQYSLDVYRGSNQKVASINPLTNNPVSFTYQPVPPYRMRGTFDESLDPMGYVEISLEPTAGAWLPAGIDFCAFSFELSATDRKTNGYGSPGNRILFRELIGISYTPPLP